MEHQKDQQIPDFSQTPRKNIPKEFQWRLEDIYPNLDAWEKDKAIYLEMIGKLDELVKGWTDSAANMFRLMNHVDETNKIEERVYSYPRLFSDGNMQDSKWQSKKGEIHTSSVEFNSKLSFMDSDILALGQDKINEYIKAEPGLKNHKKYFDTIFRLKDHILPTEEEIIMTRTGLFASTPNKAADMLNDAEIPSPRVTLSDGKRILLNTPNYIRYRQSKNRDDRHKVMQTFWKSHAKFRNTHALLLDGATKTHFFNAKTRKYSGCLEAALYPENINTAVYHTLIKTVRENLTPLHRYLKLKARMLKIELFSYNDIYASSVPSVEREFTMDRAKDIVMDALKPLGEEYTSVLRKGFDNGWMDVYPNLAKRSGAFSLGVFGVHPYVLMNYNGEFNNVSTLAHEFGHSLHSWFSDNNQPYCLAQYPIFLAEVASTFNENLLVQYMLKTEKDDLFKLYLLDQYLEDFRGTLFRQSLFAEFELDIHREIEKGQTLTADWLDQRYIELTRFYYGHDQGVTSVPDHIQNEWSYVHHFYYNFYVYQYSTGIVSSTALSEMVLNGDKSDVKRYMNFLKSGGSKFPIDTLKDAGVDLTTPKPIETAIKRFDSVVTEMEKIYNRVMPE